MTDVRHHVGGQRDPAAPEVIDGDRLKGRELTAYDLQQPFAVWRVATLLIRATARVHQPAIGQLPEVIEKFPGIGDRIAGDEI